MPGLSDSRASRDEGNEPDWGAAEVGAGDPGEGSGRNW